MVDSIVDLYVKFSEKTSLYLNDRKLKMSAVFIFEKKAPKRTTFSIFRRTVFP